MNFFKDETDWMMLSQISKCFFLTINKIIQQLIQEKQDYTGKILIKERIKEQLSGIGEVGDVLPAVKISVAPVSKNTDLQSTQWRSPWKAYIKCMFPFLPPKQKPWIGNVPWKRQWQMPTFKWPVWLSTQSAKAFVARQWKKTNI